MPLPTAIAIPAVPNSAKDTAFAFAQLVVGAGVGSDRPVSGQMWPRG